MDLPARDLPCPRPPCAGSPVVVVLCGVSVRCVFKIFVGASNSWALPLTPPAGRPFSRLPFRRTAQHFYFSFPAPIFALFVSLWCLKRRGNSNLHVWRAQTSTFEGPSLQKHHQNSTRRLSERERERKRTKWGGRGENREQHLGGPAEEIGSKPTTHTTNHHQQQHQQQQPNTTQTTTMAKNG